MAHSSSSATTNSNPIRPQTILPARKCAGGHATTDIRPVKRRCAGARCRTTAHAPDAVHALLVVAEVEAVLLAQPGAALIVLTAAFRK